MNSYIYLQGQIIERDKAKVSVTSTSAQYGINVFEGVRGYYNRDLNKILVFKLDEHINRLITSAKLLSFVLESTINTEYLRNIIQELVLINGFKEDIYIKVCLYVDSEAGWSASSPVDVMVIITTKGRSFEDVDALSCCVSSWRRINDSCMPPRVKAGPNYLNSRMALLEAKANGYDYPILLNDRSTVAEGPGACIFILRKGVLITPPLYASILESITRQAVVEICTSILALPVVEREIDRTELYVADEVFFVGTAIEIKSVKSVDHIQIGSESKRSVSQKLIDVYFNITYGYDERFNCWLTPISVF